MLVWFVNELLVLVGLFCNFLLLLLYLYSACLDFSFLRNRVFFVYCILCTDSEYCPSSLDKVWCKRKKFVRSFSKQLTDHVISQCML